MVILYKLYCEIKKKIPTELFLIKDYFLNNITGLTFFTLRLIFHMLSDSLNLTSFALTNVVIFTTCFGGLRRNNYIFISI